MKNTLKTFILLAGLTALFGWAGYGLGGDTGMLIALAFAALMNFLAYWNSDKMLLAMYRAQPIASGGLVDLVHDLAREAHIPLPRVYIIETSQPNAFATGRNPAHAAIAVTRGILNVLDRRELRGVIAHELAHIKNHDTLTMTVTATIAGALSTLAHFGMLFGGRNGRDSGLLARLALVILAPLAAMLVQMAISRTREYAADRDGAEISGDPEALASALRKMDLAAKQVPNYMAENNPGTAHMFIINPLSDRPMDNLFSTHPKTENRVAALKDLPHHHL